MIELDKVFNPIVACILNRLYIPFYFLVLIFSCTSSHSAIQTITTDVISVEGDCESSPNRPRVTHREIKMPSDGVYSYLGTHFEVSSDNGNFEYDAKFVANRNLILITAKSWSNNQCTQFGGFYVNSPRSWVTFRARVQYDDEACQNYPSPNFAARQPVANLLKTATQKIQEAKCKARQPKKVKARLLTKYSDLIRQKVTTAKGEAIAHLASDLSQRNIFSGEIKKISSELDVLKAKSLPLIERFRLLRVKVNSFIDAKPKPENLSVLWSERSRIQKLTWDIAAEAANLDFDVNIFLAPVIELQDRASLLTQRYKKAAEDVGFMGDTFCSTLMNQLKVLSAEAKAASKTVNSNFDSYLKDFRIAENVLAQAQAAKATELDVGEGLNTLASIKFLAKVNRDLPLTFLLTPINGQAPESYFKEFLTLKDKADAYRYCFDARLQQSPAFGLGCEMAKEHIEAIDRHINTKLPSRCLRSMQMKNVSQKAQEKFAKILASSETALALKACDTFLEEVKNGN